MIADLHGKFASALDAEPILRLSRGSVTLCVRIAVRGDRHLEALPEDVVMPTPVLR